MNSRVDLNLFKVFNAIYSEGNLTRASEVLHLTQPAVSHSLAKLRDAFEDPLFQRKGVLMEPTPFARSIINDVRQSLAILQSTFKQPEQFDASKEVRKFTLCLRDILESTSLPPLMRFIEKHAPEVSIISQRLPRKELESLLSSGKLDFAIDVLLPVGPEIQHELMNRDRLVVVARKGHPFLHAGLDIYTYLSLKHVLVSSRVEGPGIEDFELSRLGMKREIVLRCQHYFAACRVVAETDYLLTMPAAYAQIINKNMHNDIHELPVELPGIDVHLYWHKQVENDPANKWLRNKMLAIGSEETLL